MTMTRTERNLAARRRGELNRDGGSRRLSQAVDAQRRLNAQRGASTRTEVPQPRPSPNQSRADGHPGGHGSPATCACPRNLLLANESSLSTVPQDGRKRGRAWAAVDGSGTGSITAANMDFGHLGWRRRSGALVRIDLASTVVPRGCQRMSSITANPQVGSIVCAATSPRSGQCPVTLIRRSSPCSTRAARYRGRSGPRSWGPKGRCSERRRPMPAPGH
jgi:hypothetical protein